jgi:Imelysin
MVFEMHTNKLAGNIPLPMKKNLLRINKDKYQSSFIFLQKFFGMKKRIAALALCISTICLIIIGCTSGSDDNNNNTANYDKNAMLISWADNIIIPSFTNYAAKADALNQSAAAFSATPNSANLTTLRAAWLDAYKAYQHVGIFDIGKATDLHLIEAANTYPTDVAGIEANIASGSYNLDMQAQFTKQGFPALDYVLYGLGDTDADLLAFYTTNANAAKYKTYLTALTAKLKATADAIVADWNDGYRATFISSTNAVTGSVNQVTNNFVKNLEKDVRAPKVGIPAGLFSNGVLYPASVEAYYNNTVSKLLLNEAITASKDFFNGTTFGTSTAGPGLKEFLDAVNAKSNGQPLSTIINNQYAAINTANATLSDSFSAQVAADNTKMVAAYNTMQQQVVYTKVDMFSALSLTIDYVDGDGD